MFTASKALRGVLLRRHEQPRSRVVAPAVLDAWAYIDTRRRVRWSFLFLLGSGKNQSLGYFDDERNAAHAYDTAARALHGRRAICNFNAAGTVV